MKRPGVGVFLLAITSTCGVAAGTDRIDVDVDLRDTGYMLGDLLDERVDVHLPTTLAIDAQSLPLPGRVTPWLEVRGANLEPRRADGTQRVVVTYQIFAEAEQATRAPLPAFTLRALGGARTVAVEVPSRTFLLSPALPSPMTDQDRELRSSPAPLLLPATPAIAGTLASLVLALACAAYLLWRYDCLPFLPHAPGPLLRAWRHWRGRSKRALSPDEYATLLRDVHAALRQSAGETLYPSTLATLFERAPHLVPLHAPIEKLFGASWDLFYGATQTSPPSATAVFDVLRDAADRERGVPC